MVFRLRLQPAVQKSGISGETDFMLRLSPTIRLGLVLVLVATTGCHPTQPFYLHGNGDLAHYLEKAQQVEHADVQDVHSAEVEQARAPITLSNPEFDELWPDRPSARPRACGVSSSRACGRAQIGRAHV